MNIIKVSLFVMVLVSTLTSCLKTDDPSPSGVLIGEWVVENVIANGQMGDEDLYYEGAKLHLDNNNTFLFLNVNNTAASGNWSATDSVLTFVGADAYVVDYSIKYVDWSKLQVHRVLVVAGGEEVEITYLFRREE